jgi:hypothetical protein
LGDLLVSIALLCAGVWGCGAPDCEELCDDAKVCPQSNDDDCSATCRELSDLAQATGCTADLDDFIACVGDADDVCNADECGGAGDDLLSCETQYCLDHPDEPTCATLGDGCSQLAAQTCQTSMGCTTTGEDGETIVLPDCTVGQLCSDGRYSLTCPVLDGPCTCAVDGEELSSVGYQPDFCVAVNVYVRAAAARAACGWP